MQENYLYEYAIVRYVPDIEREEFINVGLIMVCKRKKWLKVKLSIDQEKLRVYKSPHNIDDLVRQLSLFSRVGNGDKKSGPIAELAPEERFRWLTAVKSCCLQTSRPHPGLTDNLNDEFDRLFNSLVL